MNKHAFKAQRQLCQAWDDVRANIEKMHQSSDVRPKQGNDIFHFDYTGNENSNRLKFNINPIVLLLPERAKSRTCSLFVSVKGRIEFDDSIQDGLLCTKDFGTEVGYFRVQKDKIEHIYGARYDYHEAPDHPIFHAHITHQMELINSVNDLYRKEWTSENTDDKVLPILSQVRTPTAQMDFFSVIIQLCADHLLYENSSDEEKLAFSNLCNVTNFFFGAAYRIPKLNTEPAKNCYRSPHWYNAAQ